MFRKKKKKKQKTKTHICKDETHKQTTTKANGSKRFTDSWSMGNNA